MTGTQSLSAVEHGTNSSRRRIQPGTYKRAKGGEVTKHLRGLNSAWRAVRSIINKGSHAPLRALGCGNTRIRINLALAQTSSYPNTKSKEGEEVGKSRRKRGEK